VRPPSRPKLASASPGAWAIEAVYHSGVLTRGFPDEQRLNTICEEALCPNIGEYWENRTATFLILRSILNGGPTRTAQFNLKYIF